MISENELKALAERGISAEKVQDQIATFKKGIPFVNLKGAAVVGNGILKFTEESAKDPVDTFENAKNDLDLLKFVPASGAASRMFKALFNFLDVYDFTSESLEEYIERTNDSAIERFSNGLSDFPFYEIVTSRITDKPSSKGEEVFLFVKELLGKEALNYGFYPKGLLPFHNYGSHVETPFEEHLKEGASYAKAKNKAKLHFTISEQHTEMFADEFKKANGRVSANTHTEFHVGYSNQKPSTDTIAVNMDDTPFRDADGSLLFRPGGHGALIENLNEQDADIVFIKNIDNVVVPEQADDVTYSKKMLAGVLLNVQKKAFAYAKALESDEISEGLLDEITEFAMNELNVRFSSNFVDATSSEKKNILKEKINRPIRVCGMVKNEGEPGGGPFWITDSNGSISLQIIESAQIDKSDEDQMDILKNSTHFNPVDLVCGIRNHKGEKYDLIDFVDHKQGFITEKTKDGKALKALELPGLWNGAMAFWNTIFVEVALETFNPVKTVNDLLKSTHQVS
jgi:hypothetical protein